MDWKTEADARIRQHRMSEISLRLSVHGKPLAGQQVQIRQIRNRFLMGTCIAGDPSLAAEAPYWDFVRQHHDVLVCENAMKWYATEVEAGKLSFDEADKFLALAEKNQQIMRGHCLLWSKEKFVQTWARALDTKALEQAALAQVERTAKRWSGRVPCWDVFNELLDGRYFSERLGEDFPARVFQAAKTANPAATLFVNEYGILDSDAKLERYCDLIRNLQAQGGPVSGIGVQEHAAERFCADAATAAAEEHRPERQGRGPLVVSEVWKRLDRLASFGLPIHITEVSFKTTDEERRAQALEMFVRTAYAHPAVEAFLIWGFWSKRHWLGREAALLDDDFSPLLAGKRWMSLAAEFHTKETLCTNNKGEIHFTGHRGDYEILSPGLKQTLAIDGPKASFDLQVQPSL